MIIDGTNAILGRLASTTAKKLLSGEEIVIVNAEKIIVSGNSDQIIKDHMERTKLGSPQHGPFYPRRPDMMVKRTVRGMVPKTKKGVAALRKLRVHIGNPDNLKGERVGVKKISTGVITIGEISRHRGWNS